MTDPANRKYSAEHEWVDVEEPVEGSAIATVGITKYAADKLGDIVYVDLPAVGSTVTAVQVVGEIESTKSVGELYAPVSGAVVEVNQAVIDSPELINRDPLGEGWLLKVRIPDAEALDALLSADDYAKLIGE